MKRPTAQVSNSAQTQPEIFFTLCSIGISDWIEFSKAEAEALGLSALLYQADPSETKMNREATGGHVPTVRRRDVQQ